MNNLSVNIIRSSQYIDNSAANTFIYDEKRAFKDKCVNAWFDYGKRNLKEFADSIGVNAKQLDQWIHNG